MATITEFTIIKGKALDFQIQVKENGTTLPLTLNTADVFKFTLMDKKTSVKYITDKAMTITDALNGVVTGNISAIEATALPTKKSSAEDGYLPRPNLRLVVSGSTVSQGKMTAIIEDVYVVIG